MDISDSFKDGSSELNNHSAMTVGKFVLALSNEFKFRCISSKKINNDQELIQSNPTSCPQNQKRNN